MTPDANGVTNPGVDVGDVIAGKYRLHALLGVGGMGVVFAARHTELNGEFALKFLSREALASPQAVGRFQREARAAAKLRSEHAVRVFDVGTHENGVPYIVMEYLEGGDLGRLLRSGEQLPIAEAVDYVLQTCAAIADAHKAGIIHRDIKPSNLFCVPRADQGLTIKVLDFGISKVVDELPSDGGVTATGNFIGSPSYMSPEQMRSPSRVDLRTDIWSIGVVLYECLTAKLPFPGASFPEICLRVAQDPPLPPRSHRPELPVELENIILKCLEKDREQRYASASELAAALREFAPQAQKQVSESSRRIADKVQELTLWKPIARGAPRAASFSLTQPSWVRTAAGVAARRRPLLLGLAAVTLTALAVAIFFAYRAPKVQREASGAQPAPSANAATTITPGPINDPVAPDESLVPFADSALASPLPAPALSTSAQEEQPAMARPLPRLQPVEPPSATRSAEPPTSARAPAAATPAARRTTTKPAAERDARSSTWKRR